MDESATGSANFYGPEPAQTPARYAGLRCTLTPRSNASARRFAAQPRPLRMLDVKLRPPSIDPGLTSFLWAFGLSLYLLLFMLAVGVDRATAFILTALAFCGIFLFVRLFGEEELPPYRPDPRSRPRAGDQPSASRARPR